jgi:lactoylglutathione lyase
MAGSPVLELRVALTVDDYEGALRFYWDALGLPLLQAWDEPWGGGALFDAGRATLEVLSTGHADHVDRIETGRSVPDRVRLALQVRDSEATGRALVAAGAEPLGDVVVTPWSDRNIRLRAPDGMQLTLFTPAAEEGG